MKRTGKNLIMGVLLAGLASGCSPDHESTIGMYGKVAHFPMYYLVGGDTEGSGALYRVSEVSVGQAVDSELVIDGLTAPGGLAQDTGGNIYLAEALPAPDGRVLKLPAGASAARVFAVDLEYPTGVAIDTFNQVYIIENGGHRIIKVDATGGTGTFKDTEISSPESGVIDSNDNLFLVESDAGVVSKISPAGERTVVSPVISGIYQAAIDATGTINLLWVDVNEGTGKVLRVVDETTTEEVVTGLINPLAIAFDSANAMYIAEGAPVNRISRYAAGEESRRVIVNTVDEPRALLFTPF